jgi:hypothetical protein
MRVVYHIVFFFFHFFVIFLIEYIAGFEDQRLPLINGSLSNKGSVVDGHVNHCFCSSIFQSILQRGSLFSRHSSFVHFPFF